MLLQTCVDVLFSFSTTFSIVFKIIVSINVELKPLSIELNEILAWILSD